MTLIEDLTRAAAQAKAEEKAAGVLAARLDAAAKGEAERLRVAGFGGDRHTTTEGVLRCDGLGRPPALVVEDPDALGSWLAERSPAEVTATVTVPADKLTEIIAYLEFEGITATATVRAKSVESLRDVDLVPDADAPSGWVGVHPDHGPVPGIGGRAASLRWVLTPSKALTGPAEKRAEEDADAFVASLRADTTASTDTPATEAPAEAEAAQVAA